MSNYRIKYIIIKNYHKCKFWLHHCDGLVKTIEMDISFAYFGVRMKKIGKGQDCWHHAGPTPDPPYRSWPPASDTWQSGTGQNRRCGDAHARTRAACQATRQAMVGRQAHVCLTVRAGARRGRPLGRHVAPPGWRGTAHGASARDRTARPATW
jgi:hypothetical protein